MSDGSENDQKSSRRPSRPGKANRDGDGKQPVPGGERRTAGGRRHLGRIIALQVLFETDLTDHAVREVLDRTFEDQELVGEDELPAAGEAEKVREHVERLVGGVLGLRDVIDPHIAAAAPAFPVTQLPAIDRNVLRLAIFELLHEPEVPPKAAINEAVELAKRFGGPNSGRFVNGVLGTIVERVRRDAPPPGQEPGNTA